MKFDTNAPFWNEASTMNVGSTDGTAEVPVAQVKLISSISAMKLFCHGIMPYRGFRMKDIKDYFGVKGNKQTVLAALEAIKEVTTNA